MTRKDKHTKAKKNKARVFPRIKTNLLVVLVLSVSTLTVAGTVYATNVVFRKDQPSKPLVAKSTSPTKKKVQQQQPKTQSPAPKPETAAKSPAPQPTTASASTAKPAPAPVQKAPAPSKAPAAAKVQPAAAPTGDIAPESACPGQQNNASYQSALVCMTSYARRAHGLGAVNGSGTLAASSTKKAQDLKDCGFSHTACGRAFNYWMAPSGYNCGTTFENIAAGQPTPRNVFVSWMNSPGHRANILSGHVKSVGFGLLNSAGSQYGTYWVMQAGAC